ncbi:MAG: LysR family transcriptional regulator [Emcibacter sp.]|nr:LysR family transcriptional regulator [Emcibacter sp.]
MDSRRLKYFAAIYDHGTLARASEHLHVATSALSHHITNLEYDLGAKLFIREPRGMKPTAAGERLYGHARKIIRLMKDAERDMQASKESLSGDVSVSMAYSVIKLIGVTLAKEVLTQYPNIHLSLLESLSGLTIDHMVSTQVDIALAYNPPLTSSLKLTPILNERMVLMGHKSIIGEDSGPINFEEIMGMPLFLLGRGLSSKVVFDDPKILTAINNAAIMHLYSVHAVQNLVLAKLGCVIGPITFLDEHRHLDGFHYRDIENPILTRNLYACEISDKTPTYAYEAIKTHIYGLIHNSIETGHWRAENLIKPEWLKLGSY